MFEIIAVLMLISFCLFIWKMVRSIEVHVHVSVKASLPKVQVEILPAPVNQIVSPPMEDLFDKNGDLDTDKVKPYSDPVQFFNELLHGAEEVMKNE